MTICPQCGSAMIRKTGRVGLDARRRHYYQCVTCGKIHVPPYENDEDAKDPISTSGLKRKFL